MSQHLKNITYSEEVKAASLKTCRENKVGIFIVAYNAEKFIEEVLDRIPKFIASEVAEIFIIDDCSTDSTHLTAKKTAAYRDYATINVYKTPTNQGYGGNQRLGYQYAVEKGLDIVVLLHGDGQYAPEYLPNILAVYSQDLKVDGVYGSRFLPPSSALKGGMPLYKWIGNRILTSIQNRLIGSSLSEMHSGYRSYKVSSLAKVPFQLNSRDFDFDSDIIIQFSAAGLKIAEVPIPTYYGDEICHVNGMKYAWQCIRSTLQYRCMQFEIFYEKKYDVFREGKSLYTRKSAENTTHGYVRRIPFKGNEAIYDIGGGDGRSVAIDLAAEGLQVTVVDWVESKDSKSIKSLKCDLDSPQDWEKLPDTSSDVVLALDVIEHLKDPDHGVEQIYRILRPGAKLVASSGNIAFLPIRVMLFLGFFNYGRKGILDLTHKRLFTKSTFKQLIERHGFRVTKEKAFGVPLCDLLGKPSAFWRGVDKTSQFLADRWPGLFAYQYIIEAERLESIHDLVCDTFTLSNTKTLKEASPIRVYESILSGNRTPQIETT